MDLNIITGKIQCAQKTVCFGPEGIGKSTFASQFQRPLFIDTEGSTTHMDVTRVPKPSSWAFFMDIVREIKIHPELCSTLVIDTADWAEIICVNHICAKAQVKGIEDFGYGKGYTYLEEEFGRLLNLLQEVVNAGVNVVITAHAQMRKFEQPDELGGYDRWELKLEKKTAALVKEWADMVLFANYKTFVVNVDNQGAAKGKNKAQGGSRVMHTTHHPCWDAKNRHDLPDELPFAFSSIAHLFDKEIPKATAPEPEIPKTESKISSAIPTALLDLMEANGVTVEDIQKIVAQRGYYPEDTPIENYEPGFVSGSLIGAWPTVFDMIQQNKMPFVM